MRFWKQAGGGDREKEMRSGKKKKWPRGEREGKGVRDRGKEVRKREGKTAPKG